MLCRLRFCPAVKLKVSEVQQKQCWPLTNSSRVARETALKRTSLGLFQDKLSAARILSLFAAKRFKSDKIPPLLGKIIGLTQIDCR